MIPTTKEEFKDFCLSQLGQGVIQINVSPEQVDNNVDLALFKFYEGHHQAVEEVFIYWTIEDSDITQQYVVLPADIVSVTDVMRPNVSANIFSIEYQWTMQEVLSLGSMQRFGDITYYYMSMMHLALINRLFAPVRQYEFNEITHKLAIAGGLRNAAAQDGGFVARCKRKIYGEEQDDNENATVGNIYQVKWLQDYAQALILRQWSMNMSKFQNVQLVGGVTMNGQALGDKAEAQIAKLELELETKYSLPIDFLIG